MGDPNDRIGVILKRYCERVIAHPHQNCDLKEILHGFEMGHRGRKTEAQEGVQKLWNRHRWVLESLPLTANRVTDSSLREVEKVGHELIRVLDLNPVPVENVFGEVLNVVRDDNSGL